MDLTIEKIISRGYGLAHTSEGQAVFIPFTLPGEIHNIKIIKKNKGWILGESQKLLKESPLRVKPHCPYFTICGGCQFQHMDYPMQLEVKKGIFQDNWTRLGHNAPVETEIIASPSSWGYRNRFQFHGDSNGKAGFKAENSHEIISIEECPVAVSGINRLLKEGLDISPGSRLTFLSPDGIRVFSSHSEEDCSIVLSQRTYTTHASLFFQSNISILDPLLEYISTFLPEKRGGTAFDLYSGVGLFSQLLSEHYTQVLANEYSHRVKNYYEMNCSENCHLVTGALEKKTKQLGKSYPDLILVDPPRKGLSGKAMEYILSRKPGRIIYVSCDSATLSRDCAGILKSGYQVSDARLFDFYPQTYHFESVIILDRQSL